MLSSSKQGQPKHEAVPKLMISWLKMNIWGDQFIEKYHWWLAQWKQDIVNCSCTRNFKKKWTKKVQSRNIQNDRFSHLKNTWEMDLFFFIW